MSEWVEQHLPCPKCPSSDGYSINDAGWGHCFVCLVNIKVSEDGGTTRVSKSKSFKPLMDGEFVDLVKRRIFKDTCKRFGYRIGDFHGKPCHLAPYHDRSGHVVAQKVRLPGKDFTILGDFKDVQLFGQHLWKNGGKRLVVTEGEIDCLSYGQVTNLKWPVVSVPNGASGAAKAIAANIEFVESFDEVVFLFDMDEPGQKAAKECAELVTPGKAKIGAMPLKDAGEMLVAGRERELMEAIWNAKEVRPDGIIRGSDITLEMLKKAPIRGYSTPYPDLDQKVHGIRKREITLFTAGSGIGKSTKVREIDYHFVTHHGLKIANIFLEESNTKTAQGYVAIDNNIPLGKLRENPDCISDEQYQASLVKCVHPQFFYDHFGSSAIETIIAKMRYFAVAEKVDFIILDHISMVVSGGNSDQGERKDLDLLMSEMRALVERTGVGVIGIVHLKRPDGKRTSYNEGGKVSLQDLRGSAGIEQMSDTIIALERDQQSEEDADLSTVRVLKNREWGDLGPAGTNKYDRKTGRLLPADKPATDYESAAADFEDEDI